MAALMTETAIRLTIGGAVLLLMLLLERRSPVVAVPVGRIGVQAANLALGLLSGLTLRLMAPLIGVAAALVVAEQGFGLMPLAGAAPWLAAVVGFLALDLAIYAQHRAMHTFPWLWRLHRVHHTETHLDATSALRFHPFEIAFSAGWRALVIALVGIPAVAVLVFEIAVNALALFNHANLRLPPGVDRLTRRLVVTPAMHRVHHSLDPDEQRSNFCFTVPWWDWIFASYTPVAREGVDTARVGVSGINLPAPYLWAYLTNPFR
jgi:sterol desaturase/sphingolipid hydroxylase (fatty acid hydroxylase superfamily)